MNIANTDVLVGKFVNLRPLCLDDAALTFSWRNAQRARLLNAGATSVEQQAAWISGRPVSECNYIIELKTGRPVGMLSLIGVDKVNRHGEPARFLIGDEDSAKGVPVAVEAMKLLYEFAFDKLGLVRLHGTVASGNSLMLKWQKYLGMQEEGRMRRHYFLNGSWHDAIVIGILKDEYHKIALPRMKVLIASAGTHSTTY